MAKVRRIAIQVFRQERPERQASQFDGLKIFLYTPAHQSKQTIPNEKFFVISPSYLQRLNPLFQSPSGLARTLTPLL